MSVRRVILGTVTVLAILMCTALAVPFTASGTRLLVEKLDGLGGLELQYHSGSLMGELRLARVLVPTETVIVDVRGGRLALDRRCLLRAKLCLRQLAVASVDVEVLLDDEEEAEDEDYLLWPLPFAISSSDVAIDSVRVHWEGTELNTTKIAGAAHLKGTRISVSNARAHGTRFQMIDTDDEEPDGPLDLPDIDLPVSIVLDSVVLHDSRWEIYDLRNHYDTLQLSGQWLGTELQIRDGLVRNSEWGSVDLLGELVFIHPYRLHLDGSFEAQQPPWWRGLHGAQGDFQIVGNLADLQLRGTLCDGALPLQLQASIDLVTPDWPLQLQSNGGCESGASAIALGELPGSPLTQELGLLPNWSLRANGDMQEQALSLRMTLDQADYGQVDVVLNARNRDGVLHLERSLASREQGEQSLQVTGAVHYLNELSWDLSLAVEAVAMPPQLAPLAGQLSGTVLARGRVGQELWSLEVAQMALQGEINELPAQLSGDLRLDQALNLDGSDLRVDVNGASLWLVDREGVLPSAELTVVDLSRWVDGAGGRLQASFAWDRASRSLTLDGTTTGVRLGPAWLNEATLRGRYNYQQGGDFALDVTADQVRLGEQWTDSVKLAFYGVSAQHQLRLEAQGALNTALVLDGSLVDGDWQGRLQPMSLALPLGSWRLEQAVAIDYLESTSQVSLADHCWLNESLDLCIVEIQLGESGVVKFDVDGNLGAFASALPSRFRVGADLSAKVDAFWTDLEMQSLDAAVEVGEGRVREQLLGGELAEYAWEGVSLTYSGSHEDGRLLGSLRQGGADKLALDLTVPVAPDGPLTGSFRLEGLQLNAFSAFLEQLSHLSGEASGNLQFAGRLREPEITGELSLRKGALALASTPNQLENINLVASFEGRRALLRGDVSVGGGNSELLGELGWLADLRLSLAMSGGPKQLLFPVETVVTVAEDLLLEITPERVSLTGTLDVPSGKFILGQLPQSAVEISDDVLLFDHTGEQLGEGAQIPVEIEVEVNVADRFEVATTGIEGRLGGNLMVRQARGKPLQLLGNVKIHQGKLELLGPRFDVKRGQLSFVGVPDNPNLNIVLERDISEDQVTVGIRVTGNVGQPQLDFYTRPAKPQKEVMAYVLGGRGIDRTGDSESMALALAMTSGLMQSKGMLKGVSLGVEGRDRKARAAIGGYISDRIYLSYGVGLYQPINTLTVRMDLIRNLWVEMVSGLDSSADLYYAWSKQ